MNTLFASPTEIVFDQDTNPDLVLTQTYNDTVQEWWLYICTEDVSGQYPGSKLIGTWSRDGDLLTVLDADYEAFIRPFGNDAGVATDRLDYQHYYGHPQREVQETPVPDTAAQYPSDTQPIVLNMSRRFDDTPGFEGEGWVATIEFNSPDRAPDARAIAIYTDPDHQNFLYTTGAFVFTDQGDGTFKWQAVNPAGRVTQNPEPIYYALLFGSLQEGRMTLDPEQSDRTDFFWDKNQDGTQQLSEVPLVTQENVPVTHEDEGVTHA